MSQTNAGNHKFEITGIVHEKYPFLHRIRALRDIGGEVKAGDLGGFVEAEWNLSYEDGDSWIFDDAIAANTAYVCESASLRDQAIACGNSAVRQGLCCPAMPGSRTQPVSPALWWRDTRGYPAGGSLLPMMEKPLFLRMNASSLAW